MKSSNQTKASSQNLVCGIDEAGRGPVLGPLVLCGVCFSKNNLPYLSEIGVKDSKKLTVKKRQELANLIMEKCHSYEISIIDAEEIDGRESLKITLNRLEELKMGEIINSLKPNEIYIDAVDVNENRCSASIKNLLDYTPDKLIAQHKADDLYPIVSAGSIIAKVKRDAIIEELKQEFGEIGSGYPSDKKTTDFLRKYIKKNKTVPDFARKTWDTTKKLIDEELHTKKITDYFK